MNLRRRLRNDLICHKVKTLDAGRREIEEFRGAERVVQIVASLLIPRIPQIVAILVIDHTPSDLRQTQQPQPLLRVRACHTTPHAPPRLLHTPPRGGARSRWTSTQTRGSVASPARPRIAPIWRDRRSGAQACRPRFCASQEPTIPHLQKQSTSLQTRMW